MVGRSCCVNCGLCAPPLKHVLVPTHAVGEVRQKNNSLQTLDVIESPESFISLWARAIAEILAMVCGQIGTHRFLELFLILLNP